MTGTITRIFKGEIIPKRCGDGKDYPCFLRGNNTPSDVLKAILYSRGKITPSFIRVRVSYFAIAVRHFVSFILNFDTIPKAATQRLFVLTILLSNCIGRVHIVNEIGESWPVQLQRRRALNLI